MKLKVCGMRESDNIIQLMDKVNPDFVGFIFYPGSPRHFLQTENSIPEVVPAVKRTGVFVNASKKEVLKLVSQYHLRNIQFHGNESPSLCRELMEEGLIVIKAIGIGLKHNLFQIEKYHQSCDFLLFDTRGDEYGGTGKKFNWKILQDHQFDKPWFLSGGIDLHDIDEIKHLTNQPYAIDINSRFETLPGLKNISKILDFKTQLTNDQ